MAVDAGSISSSIRIRLAQLDQDLKGVYARLDQLEGRIKVATDSKPVEKSFNLMKLAGTAAFVAIGAAVKNAVGQFATFEQSIANVASVAGGTAQDMERLEEAARNAGETTRFTATQAADALYFLASAGLDAQQSIDALDGVLQLAGATQSDLAFTAETVTAALSQFGIEAEESGRISNVFAAAIGNSQATMDKLAIAMRQAGPVAGALGISLEETTGALQSLFNAGFRGEQAGTVLRNVLGDLSNATGPVMERLNALGITFDQVNPTVHGFAEVIGVLTDAGITAADAITIFGKESGPGLATLLAEGQAGIEELTEAVTGTNAAADAYAVQNDTLAGSIDKLKSAAEALGIEIGEGLSPLLRGLIDLATNIILVFNQIPAPIKAAGAAALVAVLGVNGLAAAVGTLGIAINVALGPIAAIAAAIGGITVLVTSLIDENKKFQELEIEAKYESIAAAAGLTAEQLRFLESDLNQLNWAPDGSEALKSLTAIGAAYGKTTQEVIDLARASGNLSPIAQENLNLAEDILRAETSRYESSIRYEQLQRQAVEQTAINRTRAADEAEREADAIAEALRLEQERVRQVVDARVEAQKKTEAAIRQTNIEVELGLKTEAEGREAIRKAMEAEIATLIQLGYTGRQTGQIGDQRIRTLIAGVEELNKKQLIADIIATKSGIDYYDTMTQAQKDNALAVAEFRKRLQDEEFAAIEATKQEEAQALEERKQKFKEYADFIIGTLQGVFSALSQLFAAIADKEIEEFDRAHQAELQRIDDELQAKLEAEGVAEETKIERLNRELAEAIAEGDAEVEAEKRKEIRRQEIIEESEAKKAEAVEKAEREKAQIQYEAALTQWRLNLFSVLASIPQAIAAGVAALPIPPFPFAIAAGALAGLQVAAVTAAKPTAPTFQTGGIVPGTSYSGDNVVIRANSGEGVFTQDQMDALGLLIRGGGQQSGGMQWPDTIIIDLGAGRRLISKMVVDDIDNGVVRLKALRVK